MILVQIGNNYYEVNHIHRSLVKKELLTPYLIEAIWNNHMIAYYLYLMYNPRNDNDKVVTLSQRIWTELDYTRGMRIHDNITKIDYFAKIMDNDIRYKPSAMLSNKEQSIVYYNKGIPVIPGFMNLTVHSQEGDAKTSKP